eukprot:g4878.t1
MDTTHQTLCINNRVTRCGLAVFCFFFVANIAGVSMLLLELPVMNTLLGFEPGRQPVANHKYTAILYAATLGKGVQSDDSASPFQETKADPIHLIFSSKKKNCIKKLDKGYLCPMESMLTNFAYGQERGKSKPTAAAGAGAADEKKMDDHAGGVILWNFQPDSVSCAETQAFTVGGYKNVAVRNLHIDREGKSKFGEWYHARNNSAELWSLSLRVVTNFARYYLLSVYGGLYLDVDIAVLDPKIAYLKNGISLQGHDPTSAHRLNNAVLRLPRDSLFLDLAYDDWIARIEEYKRNTRFFAHLGPGLITRTWVAYQAKLKMGASVNGVPLRNDPGGALFLFNKNLTHPSLDCATLDDVVPTKKAMAIHMYGGNINLLREEKYAELNPCLYKYLKQSCPVTSKRWPPPMKIT